VEKNDAREILLSLSEDKKRIAKPRMGFWEERALDGLGHSEHAEDVAGRANLHTGQA
jgi:hypothetical protein